MTHAARLKKQLGTFCRLTGITVERFDEILFKLEPIYEESNRKRLSWKGRKRKIGGGMQFALLLEDRLLMLLMYYRTYVPHVFLV